MLRYLVDPIFQVINTAGKPATGGYIEVYLHGTRDKYYCASDFDGTLHPFKIPLDSLGSNIILADDTDAYDIYVYNRYGSLLMSRYKVSPVSIDDIVESLDEKKDKQIPVVAEGSPTKTIKKITQTANGNISVEFENIDFPYNIEISSPDDSIEIGTPEVDPELKKETIPISVKSPGLVKANPEDTNPNTLIDKLEVVDTVRDPEDPDDPPLLSLETTVDGQGNRKVAINEDNLRTFKGTLHDELEYIINQIGELPSDEHGYFNSSLYQTPGDGTTESILMDNFRISAGRDVHGDSIEFVPTHQEDGVDFGEVYLNPGTYILNVHYTLQYVGNPRGTFHPIVTNVGEQPFDFSYEHEDILRTTRIVTRTTRGKFGLSFQFDKDTPPMGIWVKYLEIAQIASYNHPAVTHDTTLAGSGQIGDPLGVTPAAFGKVKDIPTSISQFRTGDVIPVDGPNGPAKMDNGDLLKETAQSALYGFFKEFSSERAYDYGERVRYGNRFYFFKTHKNAGAWSSAYVEEFNMAELVVELQKILNSKACCWGNELVFANVNKGIVTNGSVGSVVDLTPVSFSGCSCGVFDCSDGDVFKFSGAGFSSYRLWCFIDENDKIISSCYASAVIPSSDPLVVLAPKGAVKVVINIHTDSKSAVKCNSIVSVVESLVDDIVKTKRNVSLYEYVTNFVNGYIATNGDIGTVVSYAVTPSGGLVSAVVACSKGDIFKYEGAGGQVGRLWCFVDSEDKIVSHADQLYVSDGVEYIEAPADGKAIFNFFKNAPSDVTYLGYCKGNDILFHEVVNGLKRKDAEIDMSVYSMSSYYEDETDALVHDRVIATNGGVGTTVDYTEVLLGGWGYIVKECAKGDVFKIKGAGGQIGRLWCFVDSEDKIVEVADENASTSGSFIYKEAPVDGKAIINVSSFLTSKVLTRANVDTAIKDNKSNVDYSLNKVPFVKLELDRTPFDPTSLLSGFDFTDKANYTSNIYALFDALALTSNGVITSFDVGDYCNESYPSYAGSEKIICYKISCSSANWGNTRKFPKKKILITGGVHGNEKASPFNLYILAWRLINDVAHNNNLFSLFAAFDFYIIPCVNLYGLANDTRWNGNGVDINRNSNTPGWVVRGEPYTSTYTGPYADSEFETRCVHKCIKNLGIDWYIDHHNYAGAKQFYTETSDSRIFMRSYNAFKEVSEFCITNQPSSFGSIFTMVNNDEYPSMCPIGINGTVGCLEKWAHEQGYLSCTIEINEVIGYADGEPHFSYDNDHFGHNTFSVGEFTLRCQLVLYGEILMDKTYN